MRRLGCRRHAALRYTRESRLLKLRTALSLAPRIEDFAAELSAVENGRPLASGVDIRRASAAGTASPVITNR